MSDDKGKTVTFTRYETLAEPGSQPEPSSRSRRLFSEGFAAAAREDMKAAMLRWAERESIFAGFAGNAPPLSRWRRFRDRLAYRWSQITRCPDCGAPRWQWRQENYW